MTPTLILKIWSAAFAALCTRFLAWEPAVTLRFRRQDLDVHDPVHVEYWEAMVQVAEHELAEARRQVRATARLLPSLVM